MPDVWVEHEFCLSPVLRLRLLAASARTAIGWRFFTLRHRSTDGHRCGDVADPAAATEVLVPNHVLGVS